MISNVMQDVPGIKVLGDRWDFDILVVDKTGALVDLTGGTVTMRIGTVTKTAQLEDQVTAKGKAVASFSPADTLSIPFPANTGGLLSYRITLTFGTSSKDTLADGHIRVIV